MDSDLVIVCHCKHHPQMYHLKNGALEQVNGALYIDPECPESTWADIEAGSKTYVWGENCPVAPQIYNGTLEGDFSLTNILDESWRILKNGGRVIFPGKYNTSMVQPIQDLIDSGAFKNKWEFSILNSNDFSFFLTREDKFGKFRRQSPLAIFTKPMSGGKRKTVKRKRRSRPVKPAV